MKFLPADVADVVARSSVDGGTLQPVMRHERWSTAVEDRRSFGGVLQCYSGRVMSVVIVEGHSLYRIRLTGGGQALLARAGDSRVDLSEARPLHCRRYCDEWPPRIMTLERLLKAERLAFWRYEPDLRGLMWGRSGGGR